jgi:hypothetical protein
MKLHYGFLAAVMAGLLIASQTRAAIIPWQDSQIVSALKPFQNNPQALAQLTGSDTILYAHPPQRLDVPYGKGVASYPAMRFNSTAVVLPIPVAQVKQALSSYQQYVGLFPTLTKASVVQQAGNITQMKYHIHVPIPIPVLSFNEDVVLQHQQDEHSISTLIIDSPVQYGMGKFEWFALDDSHTLLTLTQWGDLDKPKGFLVSTILKSFPEVKAGIPQGVNTFIMESMIKRYAPDKSLPQYAPRQIPEKILSSSQLQLVQQLNSQSGIPVMFVHRPVKLPYKHGFETMQFSSTYATLNAPLQRATQLLNSPNSYQRIFRQVRKVAIQPLTSQSIASQNGVLASITVKIGLGVIAIPYTLKLMYFQDNPNQVTYQANGGDVEYMQGRMKMAAISPQTTSLVMNHSTKIGDNAPFLLKMAKALPYADLLSTVGGTSVFIAKTNDYLSK